MTGDLRRRHRGGLSGTTSASFAYDGLDRRRAKTVAGKTTRFVYDEVDTVRELSAGGVPTANLFSGLTVDEVFSRVDANGPQDVLADALGSTITLVDTTGALRTEYSYAPFGDTTQTGPPTDNPSAFAGRENDGTGLYFYRGRYLHPRQQRFISEDLIGFTAGDPNLYAYVSNAPTLHTDPSGELAPLAPIAGAAALRCIRAAAESATIDYMSGRKIDWQSAATDCAWDALLPGGGRARRATQNIRPGRTNLPDDYWRRRHAPIQTTPGTRDITDSKPSSRPRNEVYERTT